MSGRGQRWGKVTGRRRCAGLAALLRDQIGSSFVLISSIVMVGVSFSGSGAPGKMPSIWPIADLCTLRLNNQVAWIGLMAKASRQLTRLGREAGRRIRARIATLWPLKFGLTLALATLIQVPYFLLQRFPLLPATNTSRRA